MPEPSDILATLDRARFALDDAANHVQACHFTEAAGSAGAAAALIHHLAYLLGHVDGSIDTVTTLQAKAGDGS